MALLLLNIALIGSVAANIHFGFDPRDFLTSESGSKSKKNSSEKQSPDAMNPEDVPGGQIVSTTGSKQDAVRVQQDGSRINRMEDGYGNSTVIRNFAGHKLLRKVVVRFLSDGERTGFVYGKNPHRPGVPT